MPRDRVAGDLRAGIYYTGLEQKEKVQQLAKYINLPVVADKTGYEALLSYINDRLTITVLDDHTRQPLQIHAEFVSGAAGYRRKHGTGEMLLKAIGFRKNKKLTVLDVTGGLGKDCFLMASYGCTVHVLERNRIVAALLEDGLRRALENQQTKEIAQRIELSVVDSAAFLEDLPDVNNIYDVIYLDPMFPERSKSALVKKEMQMLQKLIGCEDDTDKLFATALRSAKNRVVVKRPKTAPPLKGLKPSHSLSGKTTRFDVYMI